MLNRQKKVLTVLGLGSVILAWRGYALIEKYSPAAAEATDISHVATTTPSVAVLSEHAAIAATLKKQAEVAKQPWGRSPFADVPWVVQNKKPEQAQPEKSDEVPPAPPVQFVGTSKSGEHWLAAVQGDVVGVGDTLLDNYKIVRITRHTLTIEREGWTYTYRAGETGATVSPRSEEKP